MCLWGSLGKAVKTGDSSNALKVDFPLVLSQMKLVHFQVLFLLARPMVQHVKFGIVPSCPQSPWNCSEFPLAELRSGLK